MTPPLSEEEELHDALSPKYDQLKIQKAWWIIELIPLHLRYQRGIIGGFRILRGC